MKTHIVILFAFVASASTGSIDVERGIGISSGYGGAYGYTSIPDLKVNKYFHSSDSVSSIHNGDDGNASPAIDSVPRSWQSNVAISSGYGGAYGYASRPRDDANNIINVQKKEDMLPVTKMLTMRQMMPPAINDQMYKTQAAHVNRMVVAVSNSPGYSGYGNGIGGYSGYSRLPSDDSYGFAYASGWL